MNVRAHALVEGLVRAWNSHVAIPADQAQANSPLTDQEAYTVQRDVGRRLGWFASGRPRYWKTGGSKSAPTAAPVADAHVHWLAGNATATLDPEQSFSMTAVELEIAVRLGKAVPADASLETFAAAIDQVAPSIEICDVRAEPASEVDARFMLADQQMNRCLIIGQPQTRAWQPQDVNAEVCLKVNDTVVSSGRACHPLGHPLGHQPWLARLAASLYDGGLQAGDWVSTGSWTGLVHIKPGDRVIGQISGVGEVRLAYT